MLVLAAGSFLILQNHSTINSLILRRLAGGPGLLYLLRVEVAALEGVVERVEAGAVHHVDWVYHVTQALGHLPTVGVPHLPRK